MSRRFVRAMVGGGKGRIQQGGVWGREAFRGWWLEPALLVIAEIVAVADDDMVKEMDAHHLTCLLHPLCQLVVGSAWYGVAAGVVVADGKYGGIF